MKKTLILLLMMSCLNGYSQTVYEKYELPKKVKETSGLVYFDGHLFTHNDSGDDPILYEIDTLTGNIIREVSIVNTTNEDWEDITQDDSYIYIADIGNNYGDRKDLKIYKIEKSQLLSNDEIYATSINFSYDDQFDFSSNHHASNFDAEAITVLGDSLLIFTKNWLNHQTSLYYLPKNSGNHIAKKIGQFNINGLITGACHNSDDNTYQLCGYKGQLEPFLVRLSGFKKNKLFDGNIDITNITTNLGSGSQTEGIAYIGNGRYFLSREKYKRTVGNQSFKFTQKLYAFDQKKDVLIIEKKTRAEIELHLFPNPVGDFLYITPVFRYADIDDISIFDTYGNFIQRVNNPIENRIDLSYLKKGIYFFKFTFNKNNSKTYKVAKVK